MTKQTMLLGAVALFAAAAFASEAKLLEELASIPGVRCGILEVNRAPSLLRLNGKASFGAIFGADEGMLVEFLPGNQVVRTER